MFSALFVVLMLSFQFALGISAVLYTVLVGSFDCSYDNMQ